ncbi:MAG: DNA mismatch repair endonuclease MutL [Spirochaetes bacterium]|nr:DNA mismatch repair endonuclease MutL [Spirochaetota bacterium]
MERIQVLPDSVKKKIAAGEVVEGPFSVIKELVENSIDAGASAIDVRVFEGGHKKMLVRDNGRGIHREDAHLAVMEHATSKIRDIHDIAGISSYGFRGEALSSISSVSRCTILSRRPQDQIGAKLVVNDAGVEQSEFAGPAGTTIIVENLFYNVPARKKFLRSAGAEIKSIRETILKIAIPHPGISFNLELDDKRAITLPKTESVDSRIMQIYGSGIMNDLLSVELRDLKVNVAGYLSRPHFLKSSRSMQILYVNRRPVEYRYLGYLLTKAYEAVAVRGKYPAGIIFVEIDPSLVDVNIHPAKKEVKLFDTHYIDRLIISLAGKALDREHTVEERFFRPGDEEPRKTAESDSAAGVERERPLFSGGTSAPVRFLYGDGAPPVRRYSNAVRDTAETYLDDNESGIRIIGMAFGTYIILEKDNSIYFVDFHAAHERVIYDSIMDKERTFESQRLAFPKILEMSLDDHAIITENIQHFLQIGFDIEEFSDNSIKISAVPEAVHGSDAAELLLEFLGTVRGESLASSIAERIAATVACHAAKRSGDRMSPSDMDRLMTDIFREGRQLRCPHGRPFVYKMGRDEIERMFKRQ